MLILQWFNCLATWSLGETAGLQCPRSFWDYRWIQTPFSLFPLLTPSRIPLKEGDGTPLQYSFLENPRDGGAWWAAVHGVSKSQTWLSDFTVTFHFHSLEKEMATHSSGLAWTIPGMGDPGGRPSIRSHRVGHDWSDLAAAAAAEFLKGSIYHLLEPVLKVLKTRSFFLLRVHHYNMGVVSYATLFDVWVVLSWR